MTPSRAAAPESEVPDASPAVTSPAAWIGFGCLLLYGLITRIHDLGGKPVQHDESMFAYYAYLITQGTPYEFMPILHGPLLQWATAGIFRLLGDSDATMRLFPALCGVGLMIATWGLRRSMGVRAALFAMLFIALSPTLLFFSRFCRNDIPFLFAAMLIVWALVSFGRTRSGWPLLFATIAGGLCIAIKETYVIFLFILGAYAAACLIYQAMTGRTTGKEGSLPKDVAFAFAHRWYVLSPGIAIAALLVVTLYSSFFEYPEHADGVIEGLQYWLGEHQKHRIEGPYHFYLIHLAIYELPFLLFWLGSLAGHLWTGRQNAPRPAHLTWLAWTWAVVSSLTLVLFWNRSLPPFMDDLAHMTLGLHVWMAVQLVLLVCVACWKHLNRGRGFHAFVDCWAGSSLVIYAYAGEKVPWVTAHIALPLLISCALYADRLLCWFEAKPEDESGRVGLPVLKWGGIAAAALSLAWTLWLSLTLAFVNSGNPIERHTYASSHPEFDREVEAVLDETLQGPMGFDTRIAFNGEVAWPLWWSLRKYDRKSTDVRLQAYAPFIIIDEYLYTEHPELHEDYDWKRVRFRHYWQPLPLDGRSMLRFDLLIRPAGTLSQDSAAIREQAANEWKKLAKAMLLRDENIEGPTRWHELGGMDAYIGRLKPESDPYRWEDFEDAGERGDSSR